MSGHGVGKSILRKEDERYMRGRGQFVADFKLPGMKEARGGPIKRTAATPRD